MEMTQLLQELDAEVRRNDRVRWGLWAILTILLFYVVLVLADVNSELKSKYQAATTKLADVNGVATQDQWVERAHLTTAVRAELMDRLWQSRSEGLAQAMFQTWLDQQMTGFKLSELRTQMLPVEPIGGRLDLWKVTARLQGEVNLSALQRFIFRLENNAQVVVVESMTLRNQRAKTVDLTVTAWFTRR